MIREMMVGLYLLPFLFIPSPCIFKRELEADRFFYCNHRFLGIPVAFISMFTKRFLVLHQIPLQDNLCSRQYTCNRKSRGDRKTSFSFFTGSIITTSLIVCRVLLLSFNPPTKDCRNRSQLCVSRLIVNRLPSDEVSYGQ